VKTRADQGHSLLHCHFESALRALAVAQPSELGRLRPVFGSPGYTRASPAEKLSMLGQQVGQLAHDQNIFTHDVFAEVVRRLVGELTSSGIRHVDLRVGVRMHRWPWIGSLADAIGAFKAAMPRPAALTVSFLGAVNLSKPRDVLDAVFGQVLEDASATGLLAGLDINMRPSDLAALDLYLGPLLDLQRGGLRVNIHLGELFGAEFSRQVLSRIIPGRIGHGVLLLDDAPTVELIRGHGICLDMCPVSNTRLGVWDWTRSSPAAMAMHLGLPVTINTDDPILFSADLTANLALSGLSPAQLETARLAANRYGYQP
jgi:hypothetical protein